jgi:hypothetical protein
MDIALGISLDVLQIYKGTKINALYNLAQTRRRLAHFAQSMLLQIDFRQNVSFFMGFHMRHHLQKSIVGLNVNYTFCFM